MGEGGYTAGGIKQYLGRGACVGRRIPLNSGRNWREEGERRGELRTPQSKGGCGKAEGDRRTWWRREEQKIRKGRATINFGLRRHRLGERRRRPFGRRKNLARSKKSGSMRGSEERHNC